MQMDSTTVQLIQILEKTVSPGKYSQNKIVNNKFQNY